MYPVLFRIYGNWTECVLFLLPLVGLNPANNARFNRNPYDTGWLPKCITTEPLTYRLYLTEVERRFFVVVPMSSCSPRVWG